MDYYEPKSKSTEPDYIQFADLVDFYYPGGQQNESEKAAPEAPKDPVSRRPSEPVRNTPEPASAPTKPSSPQKPAGIFASIRRGFQEGVEKAKSERRARSGSDSDEKKKDKQQSKIRFGDSQERSIQNTSESGRSSSFRSPSHRPLLKEEWLKENDSTKDSIGYLLGFLITFLIIVLGIWLTFSYITYSFQAMSDYDDVCYKGYKVNENLKNRDNYLDLLVNLLSQNEGKKVGVEIDESFVPSPELKKVLDSQSAYKMYKLSDFKAFDEANRKLLSSLVEYLNYCASNKPEYLEGTPRYYVSYIAEYNQRALFEMKSYNEAIEIYLDRFHNPAYRFVAYRNQEHELYSKVAPFDLTDYFKGIDKSWELTEE